MGLSGFRNDIAAIKPAAQVNHLAPFATERTIGGVLFLFDLDHFVAGWTFKGSHVFSIQTKWREGINYQSAPAQRVRTVRVWLCIHYLSDGLPEDLEPVFDGLAGSPLDFVLLADFVSDLDESFLEASFPLESLLEDPASESALAALL